MLSFEAVALAPKQQPTLTFYSDFSPVSSITQLLLAILVACRLPPSGRVLAEILGHLVRAKNLNRVAIWVKYEGLRGW